MRKINLTVLSIFVLQLSLSTIAIGATSFTVFKDLGYSGYDVDWSNNGNLVAIKTSGNETYLIKDALGTPQLWQTVITNCNVGRGAVKFSPDSLKLFTSGEGNPQEMAVFTLNYPGGTPSLVKDLDGNGKIEYRACDWQGSYILVGRTNDNECVLYNPSNLSIVNSFNLDEDCTAVAFDKDNPSRFVFGDDGGYIYAKQTNGSNYWQHHTDDMINVQSAAWKGDIVIVGDRNGQIYRYAPTGGIRLGQWSHGTGSVTSVEISPDGQWLATCSGSIKIWNTSTWTEDYVGPSAACVAWDPTSTYLVDNAGKVYAPFGEPPVITQHPQNQTVCEGDSVTFNITATGTEPLTYQWRKDESNIGGATSSSYTIDPVIAGDAGDYDCVVTNAVDSVTSNEATLTVNSSPVIIQHPLQNPDPVCDGNDVTLTIVATGDSLHYQWKVDDVNVGSDNPSYLWTGVNLSDNGSQIICEVWNDCGIITSDVVILNVESCESFIAHPADTDFDGRITISEVTLYGSYWKTGQSWPTGPNPIPISYVTNSGYLWKTGECYDYNDIEAPPQCWQPSSCGGG